MRSYTWCTSKNIYQWRPSIESLAHTFVLINNYVKDKENTMGDTFVVYEPTPPSEMAQEDFVRFVERGIADLAPGTCVCLPSRRWSVQCKGEW